MVSTVTTVLASFYKIGDAVGAWVTVSGSEICETRRDMDFARAGSRRSRVVVFATRDVVGGS